MRFLFLHVVSCAQGTFLIVTNFLPRTNLLSSLLTPVRKLGQLTAKKSSTDGERCFYQERDGKSGGGGVIMAEEAAMTVKREEGP